jgi:hypothetical protein
MIFLGYAPMLSPRPSVAPLFWRTCSWPNPPILLSRFRIMPHSSSYMVELVRGRLATVQTERIVRRCAAASVRWRPPGLTYIDWRGYPTVHSAATKLGLEAINLIV